MVKWLSVRLWIKWLWVRVPLQSLKLQTSRLFSSKEFLDIQTNIECGLTRTYSQTWKSFNTKFLPQWKDRESIYKVRQILALSCNLIALTLSYNCVKGLRVIKIIKEIKFEGVWGKFEAKNCFQRQPFTKYLRLIVLSMWNSALWEKFNFCFQEFASIDKIFILAGGMGIRLSFYDV